MNKSQLNYKLRTNVKPLLNSQINAENVIYRPVKINNRFGHQCTYLGLRFPWANKSREMTGKGKTDDSRKSNETRPMCSAGKFTLSACPFSDSVHDSCLRVNHSKCSVMCMCVCLYPFQCAAVLFFSCLNIGSNYVVHTN